MSKPLTTKQIKQQRQRAAQQFELESLRLGYVVERPLTNFRYLVREVKGKGKGGQPQIAMVLPTSFDFYVYRLNSVKRRVNVLIVQRHNAVVPVKVVSLSQVTSYEPLYVPQVEREKRQRRNHEEAMLFVSKLLLNFESAWEELQHMSDRSRQRYLRLRDEYLKPRVGRPWAS